MKVLTIRQPWAWAIIWAGKDIENRTWNTHYRGPLAIHAGLRIDKDVELPRRVRAPDPDELECGAIIGVVELVDVVERSRSKWFEGPMGLVLRNPRPLARPIICKGRLGLWDLTPAKLRQVQKLLRRKTRG
ncbi:MAG: ASCH domain-containing protein [Polyangiaceae bacterium]|nr:ASCH domain-containing protein [Polyangiaceae bacterium]